MSRWWPGSGSSQTGKWSPWFRPTCWSWRTGGEPWRISRRPRAAWCQRAIVSGWTYRILCSRGTAVPSAQSPSPRYSYRGTGARAVASACRFLFPSVQFRAELLCPGDQFPCLQKELRQDLRDLGGLVQGYRAAQSFQGVGNEVAHGVTLRDSFASRHQSISQTLGQ
jgi:hypothetical protein